MGGAHHVPLLLWWAVESHVQANPAAVVDIFQDKTLWQLTLVQEHILERLMRRLASSGRQKDLVSSARLLQLAPDRSAQTTLMKGFEKAFEGRSLADLPPQLIEAIATAGGGSLKLRLRQSQPAAITESLKKIGNPKTAVSERVALLEVFGQAQQESSLPTLLKLVRDESNDAVVSAALISLISYDDAKIPVILDPITNAPETFDRYFARADAEQAQLLAGLCAPHCKDQVFVAEHDGTLAGMNFYVEGIEGTIPQ
jgi:predicted transcriptional regulator